MTRPSILVSRPALAVAVLVAALASLGAAAPRQYYSDWMYHPGKQYHYRSYYYKPNANFAGYNYHYAIHYPSEPRYVYYFNPYKRTYWGRYDTQGRPGQEYSLLAEKDCREVLKDIPAAAFPAPGKMPAIPESSDGAPIEPPRDLPKPSR